MTEDRKASPAQFEAAWCEMHDHLSWMQGHPALRRYLGLNFGDIANCLIDLAYPGLRQGKFEGSFDRLPPPVPAPDAVERVAQAIYEEGGPFYEQPLDPDNRPTGPAGPIAWVDLDGTSDAENFRAMARAALAAAPTPDAAAIRPDSWTAAAEDVREQVLLLAEVELHLQSCRVFLTTREKMHPCGVDLHDELLAKVTAAIETIGREKANG